MYLLSVEEVEQERTVRLKNGDDHIKDFSEKDFWTKTFIYGCASFMLLVRSLGTLRER